MTITTTYNLDLERPCSDCQGHGYIHVSHLNSPVPVPPEDDSVACHECRGTGFVPTQQGKELLEFIRRQLGIDCDWRRTSYRAVDQHEQIYHYEGNLDDVPF